MRYGWIDRPLRERMLVTAIFLLGYVMAGAPVWAQESSLTGFVMDVDRKAATLEIERQQGDFTILHLDKGAQWVLQKIDVGDRIHARVVKENNRLVAKEISLQIGPVVQVDLFQGTVTKVNRRAHTIEVKTSLGTEEVLHLDRDSLGILGKVAAGDGVEVRVETLIEAGGAKKIVRSIIIGKGP